MTAAPEDANQTRFEDGTLPADDGGNGNDVIRIGGMAHPEKAGYWGTGLDFEVKSIGTNLGWLGPACVPTLRLFAS